MIVESLSQSMEREVEALCSQLRGFSGYRTVWLDREGELWHAEPDEMLEELGHRYVGTFFRPEADVVSDAVAAVMPARRPATRPTSLPSPGFARVGALAPA